jgi:hypothetical protein
MKLKLLFFLVFITLVLLFAADFDNIGNVQFAITAIVFLLYLGVLSEKINLELFNNMSTNSCSPNITLPPPFDKYVELPSKIKNMIGNEFDLLQRLFMGMKDVMGNDPNEVSYDETTLSPLTGAALSNVQQEYHDIDKVFRDLLIVDSNLYIQKVYNAGNK